MNYLRNILLSLLLCLSSSQVFADIPRDTQQFKYKGNSYLLKVPSGFKLELLDDRLDGPRLMSFDAVGNLFIGSKSGDIYRLEPPYQSSSVFTSLDNYPHSLAFSRDYIYVAQADGLYRASYKPEMKKIKSDNFKLVFEVPDTGGHTSRSIAVGPDNRLYLSLGITGNCSDEYLSNHYDWEKRKGGLYVFSNINSKLETDVFATGLRNPVGFDWHPQSQLLYASNNGPDHMGFELPPEYFSKVTANSFHGMPWFQFNGKEIIRDNCIGVKPPKSIEKVQKPVAIFDARNAPMGVAFIKENSVLKPYINSAIVALRGSWAMRAEWNPVKALASRRHPKLMLVQFNDKHQVTGVDEFVTGFQFENGSRLLRPVGVVSAPDGNLYFTSDSGIEGLFRLVKQ